MKENREARQQLLAFARRQSISPRLVERITAVRPGLKSLYVSGYTADSIGVQGILDDDVNFLEKPYRFDDLAGKIREILTS